MEKRKLTVIFLTRTTSSAPAVCNDHLVTGLSTTDLSFWPLCMSLRLNSRGKYLDLLHFMGLKPVKMNNWQWITLLTLSVSFLLPKTSLETTRKVCWCWLELKTAERWWSRSRIGHLLQSCSTLSSFIVSFHNVLEDVKHSAQLVWTTLCHFKNMADPGNIK